MKKEFVTPILVLTLICLFISAALAITNHFTEPVIAKAAACREEAARCEVVPGAGSFELLQADGLPATVKEVYKASNGAGYVFVLTVSYIGKNAGAYGNEGHGFENYGGTLRRTVSRKGRGA
jgi:electron transport complex protein RnfG